MDVKFRYEYLGKGPLGNIYRPIAKVTLLSPHVQKSVDVWMIVDTGADFTILPKHISEKLRISFEKDCTKDVTEGVGGKQVIYLCKSKLKAKIGSLERNVPIGFFDTNEVPALLGRLGFLETFDVSFLKTHNVVFKA